MSNNNRTREFENSINQNIMNETQGMLEKHLRLAEKAYLNGLIGAWRYHLALASGHRMLIEELSIRNLIGNESGNE